MQPTGNIEELTGHQRYMRLALRLAAKGYGAVSPNPMVGAVLVRDGRIIGRGWHKKAGEAHAEVNALQNAVEKGEATNGSTLYVTLEPCSTHGRTPPCTEAIVRAGVSHVVVAATDPNPLHAGRAFETLRAAGLQVTEGIREREATELNEAFNHWMENGLPFVTVKSALSLDGKIATISGQSKWITGPASRRHGMWLRLGADGILAGVNTIIADDPALSLRPEELKVAIPPHKKLTRIILDPGARTPPGAKVLSDPENNAVIITTGGMNERKQILAQKADLLEMPSTTGSLDLRAVLIALAQRNITSILVEGGGETIARFLEQKLANRLAFFHAPIIIGGRLAPRAIGGEGLGALPGAKLTGVKWRKFGVDLFQTARIRYI